MDFSLAVRERLEETDGDSGECRLFKFLIEAHQFDLACLFVWV